ncbi:DNA ligase (NAD(+)) [Candidatus Phytoplasma luffae]|uniref:DNA ligase n=1 Tax=Loofah witches'-broom phytoplasma TaxID=35773 RepID=A0A975FIU2_LOWBP|nr:NAD-dependent DNA ligase LigA [Candidatus Phytoplasma luffae]QTX02654.1 DNA ligase (NAD(+)) [Candidatus Phytoplasma luffae]
MSLYIKKKIEYLTEKLNKANYEYYHLNISKLSDNQYDASLKELFLLEKQYPNYKLPYSPTLKVGGVISSKFDKAKHKIPMLSLDNVFNFKELKEFCDRLFKKNIPFNFITEFKIDGVAISLKYKDGILFQALTRGDGMVGEIITENVKTIKNIPLKLNKKIDLEVRGEIFFDHDSFEKLNQNNKKENKILFSNPRNAASGTLRQLNSSIVAKRNLSSFIYSIVNTPSFIKTQKQVLIFLKEMGFSVNNYNDTVNSFEELKNKIIKYENIKNNLPYNVDGVVVKVNQLNLYPLIGYTTKFPKWSVAYKFNSLKSETIVKKITFQIGKTGAITPIAHLEPVIIDGSLISKVSLHNYDYIKTKDIRINDFVLIHKSGSIIPQILEVIKEKRTNQIPFQMITNCPSCENKLQQKKNKTNYFCFNPSCEEKKINKIIHFVSNEAMDIKNLGEKTLITLFKENLIQNISDLYSLKDKYNQLKKLPNFENKKILKIFESIEKSKTQSLNKILFGLGIGEVGVKVAKLLQNQFNNIDNLQKTTLKQLLEIKEIGPEIAHNIYQYFQNKKNIEEINLLKKGGVLFNNHSSNEKEVKPNIFKNKKIVLTGVFQNYSRKDIEIILEKKGAFILDNISSKIDYLIKGEKAGSKLDKALFLKIQIIDEPKLKNIIEEK